MYQHRLHLVGISGTRAKVRRRRVHAARRVAGLRTRIAESSAVTATPRPADPEERRHTASG